MDSSPQADRLVEYCDEPPPRRWMFLPPRSGGRGLAMLNWLLDLFGLNEVTDDELAPFVPPNG